MTTQCGRVAPCAQTRCSLFPTYWPLATCYPAAPFMIRNSLGCWLVLWTSVVEPVAVCFAWLFSSIWINISIHSFQSAPGKLISKLGIVPSAHSYSSQSVHLYWVLYPIQTVYHWLSNTPLDVLRHTRFNDTQSIPIWKQEMRLKWCRLLKCL